MKHLILSAFIAGGVCLALFFADSALDTWTAPDRIRAETESARAGIDAERSRTDNQIRMLDAESRVRLNERIWDRIEADHSWLIFGVFSLFSLCCFLFFRLYAEIRRVDYLRDELKHLETRYSEVKRIAYRHRQTALIAN